MWALVRYVAADALRAQQWMAPLLCFLAVIAVVNSDGGGPPLPIHGASAVTLLPVALWLSRVVHNAEDPVQAAVTVVTVGSRARVALAKAWTAYLACVPFTVIALVWTILSGHPPTPTTMAAGLVAHLTMALCGVAFGALLSRSVVRRTAWAVLASAAVCLVQLLVPGVPPARQVLALFNAAPTSGLAWSLALIVAQTAVLAVAVFTVAYRLARSRA